MSKIIRYSILKEQHSGPNVFLVHRPNVLGNPYVYIHNKNTKGLIKVKTKEESIKRYKKYFDHALNVLPEVKTEFDNIVNACMNYDTVYIGCLCSNQEECHADYIIKKVKQECTKQMLKNLRKQKKKNLTT